MVSCEYFLELLSAGLDGELTAEEERELSGHLASCPECRELAARLTAVHAAFPQLEEIPAPEGFAAGVMDRIRAEEKGKTKVIPLFRRPQFRAAAGLAACALLCVGLYRGIPGAGRDNAEAAVISVNAAAGARADGEKAAANDLSGTGTYDAAYEMMSTTEGAVTLPVSGVRYVGLEWREEMESPFARVLEDAEDLKILLNDLGGPGVMGEAEITGPTVAVVLTEPSGSITHELVRVTEEAVTIHRNVPEAGTCDMAAWLILVETDGFEGLSEAPDVILLEE